MEKVEGQQPKVENLNMGHGYALPSYIITPPQFPNAPTEYQQNE